VNSVQKVMMYLQYTFHVFYSSAEHAAAKQVATLLLLNLQAAKSAGERMNWLFPQ